MSLTAARSLRLSIYGTLLLLVSLTAQAQKISAKKYDPTADFSQFKTYAWGPHGTPAHPMLAADVVGAIDDQLKQKGLQEVTSNPDLIIQVYGAMDQDTTFYSDDPLYNGSGGIPPFDPSMTGPADSGMYGSTSVTLHKGDMVVDVIQAKTKKLVWRGMASQSLSSNPDKLLSEVNNAVVKIFKQYPR